jgi:hypothetical protein
MNNQKCNCEEHDYDTTESGAMHCKECGEYLGKSDYGEGSDE